MAMTKLVVVAILTVAVGSASACNMKPAEHKGQRVRTIAKANVASFDPDEAVNFDLNAYGSDRPDQYAIEQAFNGAFPAIDECVGAEKDRLKSEDQLPGDLKLAIKLNPKDKSPFAVNAELAEGLGQELTDCLREAAAGVAYPTYDGPPVVVKFELELDPGFE